MPDTDAESTTPEDAEVGEPTEASAETQGEAADEEQGDDEEGDTFPRSYVEKLRRENANYRERARTADRYAKRLHTELVRATGRLADPTDLEFSAEHLEDPDALAGDLDGLLTRKPHRASRRART